MDKIEMVGERIEERLQDYYPNDKFSIHYLSRVKTKPGSMVYKIKIFDEDRGYRDLYAKEYREELSSNIHEIMGLKNHHGLFLMPRMIDYYDDLNVILSEGSIGETLTKCLLKHTFHLDKTPLISCSRAIGYAIGTLQNQTNRGTKRVGDLDLYLTREIETEDYFKTILKNNLLKNIRARADDLKSLKTTVAQHHGDPSPHNILLKDYDVHLIDYSFQDSAMFLDPSLYIVSLELARARYGLPVKNTILEMEHDFLRVYGACTKENWEASTWALIKTLTYLHFLLIYAKREKSIKKSLVAAIDRRYLLRQINDYGRRSI